jgi:hypothetical protein
MLLRIPGLAAFLQLELSRVSTIKKTAFQRGGFFISTEGDYGA